MTPSLIIAILALLVAVLAILFARRARARRHTALACKAPTGTARNILLIDPNALDTNVTVLALRKQPCVGDVHVVANAAAAIDYLPDTALVLLDVDPPESEPIVAHIRRHPSGTAVPIVVLTTAAHDGAASGGLRANSYVLKPAVYTDFVRAVRTIAERWLRLNAPAA